MEDLTPELERRLQVEETWARRLVLSDMINERRLAAYGTRRMLLRFHTADFSSDAIAVPEKTSKPQPVSAALENIVPARPEERNTVPRAPGRTYWAAAIAATAVILLGTGILSGRISWAELATIYSPHAVLEEEGPTPADVLARTSMDLPPQTEASTLAESNGQAQPVSPAQASGVERPDLREEVRLRIQAAQQVADRAGEHAAEQRISSEATGP